MKEIAKERLKRDRNYQAQLLSLSKKEQVEQTNMEEANILRKQKLDNLRWVRGDQSASSPFYKDEVCIYGIYFKQLSGA